MSEPASLQPSGQVLQYEAEAAYVNPRVVAPGAVAEALACGVVAALVGAVIAAAYMHLRLPLAVIVSPVAPGLLVGRVLGWACKRFKLASQAVAIVLAVVCCLVSVMLYHGGMYLFSVLQLHDEAAQIVARFAGYGPSQRQLMVSFIQHHPFQAYDQLVTLPAVHHGGFLGFILTRTSAVWIFGIIQVCVGTYLAVRISRRWTKLPFCVTCGRWFREPVNISVLPLRCADALIGVIQNGDIAGAEELSRYEDAPLGTGCSVARLYKCLGCQERFVEVVAVVGSRNETKLRPTRANPELVRALKDGPPKAALPEAPV